MERNCAACGSPYEAKTSRSKYCSERCKRRYHRGARAEEPAPQRAKKRAKRSADEPATIQSVEAATIMQLAEANRLGTPLGQSALILARRLDASSADTGAGVASLAKQLQATLDAALANADTADDPLDELRARREAKRAG